VEKITSVFAPLIAVLIGEKTALMPGILLGSRLHVIAFFTRRIVQ
jgi:hypothetical protein